jgi:outer membrane biosynthesis protein TonB
MRTPQVISDFLDWRWAPSVGLTAGSLAFVALALLLIPTSFGPAPAAVVDSSTGIVAVQQPTIPRKRALFGSAIAAGVSDRIARQPAVAAETSPPVQRGFSPVADRPEPPPQPVPQAAPAPAPPPLPEPAAVTVVQPEPAEPSREVTNP